MVDPSFSFKKAGILITEEVVLDVSTGKFNKFEPMTLMLKQSGQNFTEKTIMDEKLAGLQNDHREYQNGLPVAIIGSKKYGQSSNSLRDFAQRLNFYEEGDASVVELNERILENYIVIRENMITPIGIS